MRFSYKKFQLPEFEIYNFLGSIFDRQIIMVTILQFLFLFYHIALNHFRNIQDQSHSLTNQY